MEKYINFIIVVMVAGFLVATTIYFARFGISHIFDVKVGDNGVDFLIFNRFCVGTIKFSSIEAIYERPFGGADEDGASSLLFNIPLRNRFRLKTVVIRLKTGLFRTVALTPLNAKSFICQAKARMSDTSRKS